MEKSIDELKPDPSNPRTMGRHDAKSLSNSMTRFGDLSPVVFNVRTQQLVGGHQRVETMKRLPANEKRIVISMRHEAPEPDGTVALGYIYIGNKPFAYREVDWDPETQKSANIAANRIQGEFDLDLLARANYELNELEDKSLLEATGQTPEEIDRLLGNKHDDEPAAPKDDKENVEFSVTKEQLETIEEALGHIKATHEVVTPQNTSMQGNALYFMAVDYLNHLHNDEPVAPTNNETE